MPGLNIQMGGGLCNYLFQLDRSQISPLLNSMMMQMLLKKLGCKCLGLIGKSKLPSSQLAA